MTSPLRYYRRTRAWFHFCKVGFWFWSLSHLSGDNFSLEIIFPFFRKWCLPKPYFFRYLYLDVFSRWIRLMFAKPISQLVSHPPRFLSMIDPWTTQAWTAWVHLYADFLQKSILGNFWIFVTLWTNSQTNHIA